MIDSRDEMTTMMQSWEQGFPTFAGAEEAFIFELLKTNGQVKETKKLDWQRLAKFFFVLPHFYFQWKRALPPDPPANFLTESRQFYMSNLTKNQHRLKFISSLAKAFQQANLQVIFIKGAAELTRFSENSDFLACRFMTDVDVLCRAKDIGTLDKVLQDMGQELFDFEQKDLSRQEILDYSINNFGHWVYNANSERNLEVHPAVPQPESYPLNFTESLFEQAQLISIYDSQVWVPGDNHMFVYHFCNAASRRDQNVIVDGDIGCLFDLLSGNTGETKTPALINKRLDAFQLYVLTRLDGFLAAAEGKLDREAIRLLIDEIPDTYLRDMYLDLASFVLGERFPVQRNVNRSDIDSARTRYMAGICVPLLMVKKLEQSVADRLAPIIEARLIERIKEAILRKTANRLPGFVHRWLKKTIESLETTP